MITKVIAMLLGHLAVQTATARRCTIQDDVKSAYTPCHPFDNTATVFFYYDEACDPEEEIDYETGHVTKNGSQTLPSYFEAYECSHLCDSDGKYSFVDLTSAV